jgi:hypothetical protein
VLEGRRYLQGSSQDLEKEGFGVNRRINRGSEVEVVVAVEMELTRGARLDGGRDPCVSCHCRFGPGSCRYYYSTGSGRCRYGSHPQCSNWTRLHCIRDVRQYGLGSYLEKVKKRGREQIVPYGKY